MKYSQRVLKTDKFLVVMNKHMNLIFFSFFLIYSFKKLGEKTAANGRDFLGKINVKRKDNFHLLLSGESRNMPLEVLFLKAKAKSSQA